ncbi:hypothetical protein EBS02_10260 [bacterium]|nr:hypothetical protein [bacterium]
MKNQTTQTTQETYNGWANYETWNVALWMQNNMFLYNTAVACVEYHDVAFETAYEKFIRNMHNVDDLTTGDGVSWDDELVNHDEINAMMLEIHEGGQV